jgi:hypothetical protein
MRKVVLSGSVGENDIVIKLTYFVAFFFEYCIAFAFASGFSLAGI